MVRVAFLLMALFPVSGLAQAEFGLKAGLNISDIVMTNFVDPDVEEDLRIKAGLHAGIYINGVLQDRIGLAAELLYSNKGVNANGNINLHYVTIPLLVQYQLTDNLYAEIGPELGYLFSAMSDYGNASNTYNNKFDLALDGGFRLNTDKLIFGVRYCAGVFSVREPIDTFTTMGNEKIKYQNRVLQLSVGYRLRVPE